MRSNTLEYQGYQGSIEVSLEDNVLHGKILHIVDLVTYEAQSPEGLQRAFEEQVDEYLAFCKEEGVSPDKPFSGTFNVRLTPDLHRRLAMEAIRLNLSLNNTVKRLITTWLEECPEGFSVRHHHTHEHKMIHTGEETFRGAVALTQRKQAAREPKVTLQ